jgi:hypothetical protein
MEFLIFNISRLDDTPGKMLPQFRQTNKRNKNGNKNKNKKCGIELKKREKWRLGLTHRNLNKKIERDSEFRKTNKNILTTPPT